MNPSESKRKNPMLGAAGWIRLAAAPTFAAMALLTGVLGGGPPGLVCSVAHGPSPLSGMALMYLLMSVFHSPPWLRRISRGRNAVRRSDAPRLRAFGAAFRGNPAAD